MKRFAGLEDVPAVTVEADHGGKGPILFRRLLQKEDFQAPVNFVDFTIIPPGSVIGFHKHYGNEEMYLIASGHPKLIVDGEEKRVEPGTVAIVRTDQGHSLINDTDQEVAMFVVEVALAEA